MLKFLTFLFSFSKAGEIRNLPGLNFEMNFKQYSGYLNVTSTENLHYWFIESQNDPTSDPLLLWFNGGPGCSSLMGAISEIGPFFLNQDGATFQKNEYSWNKNASIVFLESPAGVGFSYTTNKNYHADDDRTLLENYKAIKEFFRQHQNFRNHLIFLTGESYAGIYLPLLAEQIIDGQNDYPINLQGVAIGNGYVDEVLNNKTLVEYLYGRGFIASSVWNNYNSCLLKNKFSVCYSMVNLQIVRQQTTLDPYDLSCDPKTTCVEYDAVLELYFNQESVREALHISPKIEKWVNCNTSMFESYVRKDGSMDEQVKKIVANKIRVLLYYGDTDTVCNFLMGQQFSASLGLPLIEDKQECLYKTLNGGFKTEYESLTFLTVRGAGHMAPRNKPAKMFHIIQNFIANTEI